MKVLTLHRPWAWAIVHGPKRVENRNWRPDRGGLRIGEPLFIHAGLKFDHAGYDDVREILGVDRLPKECEDTGIVGIASLKAIVSDPLELPDDQVKWFCGRYGWLLGEVMALKPYRVRGAQGLWEVGGDVLEQLEPANPDHVFRYERLGVLDVDSCRRLDTIRLPGSGPVARIWNGLAKSCPRSDGESELQRSADTGLQEP